MNVFLPSRRGRVLPGHLAVVTGGVALLLIVPRARGEYPLVAAERAAQGPLARCQGNLPPASLPGTVNDVVPRPGGVLEGQIVFREQAAKGPAAAGLPVALLRAAKTVATTVTDARGKFAFGDLRGGLYRLRIETADGPCWRFYRLWTAEAAPPHASDRVRVFVARRLIRGQSPFPFRKLPRAATVVAIAAGAIVPPVIYHGVKRDGYIPASP